MLSAREIRKLMIAKGLLQSPSLIILDEPTNHMDLDSIVSLELALKEYKGTMIIVSHDSIFLNAVTDMKWNFENRDNDNYQIIENAKE